MIFSRHLFLNGHYYLIIRCLRCSTECNKSFHRILKTQIWILQDFSIHFLISRTGPEGYLCPSQVDYVKIHRALNVEGLWRVILQHVPQHNGYGHSYNYTQTTRLEACLTPDSACRLLAPCYGSKCTQKYIYHRMLSFDPCDPYRGFFMDTYKLPSGCSCHIPDGPALPALAEAPAAKAAPEAEAAPTAAASELEPIVAVSLKIYYEAIRVNTLLDQLFLN